jgi:hypothetical protein
LGNLEENVAGQGQTFQEQGQNIGEVAAADQAAEGAPIPTPEQAPEVSADMPDTNSPVSPQPVGDTLPPAAPQETTPPARPTEVSPINPANPEAEDPTARVDEFLNTDFATQVTVRAGIVDRPSFERARFLSDLQQSVRNARALGIPDQQILGIINKNMEALESNNRGMA